MVSENCFRSCKLWSVRLFRTAFPFRDRLVVFVRDVVGDIQSGRFEISLVVVEKLEDNICRISPKMNEN